MPIGSETIRTPHIAQTEPNAFPNGLLGTLNKTALKYIKLIK